MAASKTVVKAKQGKGKGVAKPAAKAGAAAKAKKPNGNGHGRAPARKQRPADVEFADPALFDPLTPGETADALRTLIEDRRVSSMAKVGRYRVICTEPLVVKPPHWMAGHRLARVVAYDYAADRAVDACVDLDAGVVAHLELTKAQPMLSREEEAIAVSIANDDDRVREKLALGDAAHAVMHYWGRNANELAYSRRSAAVIYGRESGQSSVVAVVDLLDNTVTSIVPAGQW
jgi:Cu2+-containing amine oxidase